MAIEGSLRRKTRQGYPVFTIGAEVRYRISYVSGDGVSHCGRDTGSHFRGYRTSHFRGYKVSPFIIGVGSVALVDVG